MTQKFGLGVRGFFNDSTTWWSAHPQQTIIGISTKWKDLQATNPGGNADTIAGLTATELARYDTSGNLIGGILKSVKNAHDSVDDTGVSVNHQILVRVECGAKAPGARSNPAQPSHAIVTPPAGGNEAGTDWAGAAGWLEAAGVPFLNLYSTDPNGYDNFLHVPVPWTSPYRNKHNSLLLSVAAWQDQTCPFGTNATFPTSHKISAHIHSWALARAGTHGTEMTMSYFTTNNRTGVETANRTSWNAAPGVAPGTDAVKEAQRRTLIYNTWKSNWDDHMAADPSWWCSLAGGEVFGDQIATASGGFAQAVALVDYIATQTARDRTILMATNLHGLKPGGSPPSWNTPVASGWDGSRIAGWLLYGTNFHSVNRPNYDFYVGLQFNGQAGYLDNVTKIDAAIDMAMGLFETNTRHSPARPRIMYFEPGTAHITGAASAGPTPGPQSNYNRLLQAQTDIQPPVDTTPPVWGSGSVTGVASAGRIAVTGVTAVDAVSSVKYVWTRTGGAAFTAVETNTPALVDTSVVAGVDYTYHQQAKDTTGNLNATTKSSSPITAVAGTPTPTRAPRGGWRFGVRI